MGQKKSLPLLFLVLAMLWMTSAQAENLFVSPSGKDANKGSSADQPLEWIQTAINKSKPGDTIYLMPGTHKVKPGDRNITFSGKKGTEKAPITVTTSGPGVVVDLTEADSDWGGFRISDGSEWIVLDGGGTPSPFDESSYRIVLMNAAYHAATGDDRSGISCRPVTIQQASHITVRNIFGKHSMGGMGIFGTTTRNVLVENCRLQPGDKPHDPGASHGIYVGGGADDVMIRQCFIRWGGDGRLGVQNNHGGANNVVMEQCYVTECQAVIKAFNGGAVVAKKCYFWKIDETPLQGNAKAEECTNAEPPADVIASFAKSAGVSGPATASASTPASKTQPANAQAPAAPSTAVAQAKPAAPAAQAKPPQDHTSQRSALRTALQKAPEKKSVKVAIKLFGKNEDVAFVGATASGLNVFFQGNTLPMPWKGISDVDLARFALTCLPDDPAALYNAGLLAYAEKEDTLYGRLFERLIEINSDRALSMDDICKGH